MKPRADTRAFENALAANPAQVRYRLRLFVTGSTTRSLRAIQNIRKICEEKLPGRYSLEVIDAYQSPAKLKPDQIVVTPTLIKKLPFPIRRIIGDLSDKDRVLIALDLIEVPTEGREPPR